MYMLNLQFDPNRTDGLFEDNNNGGNVPALQTSKSWLTAPDPSTWPSSFNPANYTWTVAGPDNSILMRRSSNPGMILVRFWAPSAPSNLTIRLSVVFGRKNRGSRVSSPFLIGSNACCLFDSNFDSPAADGSYCWTLGYIQTGPNNPNGSDKYEFLVGASLRFGAVVTSTFGHDPEMDVAS
jgi:hypothetical protein